MFISYAQNFEDVILWRVFKTVENGFYIDIGACDPDIDTVSKAFHQHGWRGIHIEPIQEYADKLRLARPDDRVIQAVVSNSADAVTFYNVANTGLSTGIKDFALKHTEAGFAITEYQVPAIKLESILEELGDKPIHWMKIDVEGMEKNVLESWGPASQRPRVLVIEATLPNSSQRSHMEWEALVLEKGYEFCFFDGLNNYYCHRDHLDLKPRLQVPANVFDAFSVTRTSWLAHIPTHELHVAEEQLALSHSAIIAKQQEIDAFSIKAAAFENQTTEKNLQLAQAQQENAARTEEMAKAKTRIQQLVLQNQALNESVHQLTEKANALDFQALSQAEALKNHVVQRAEAQRIQTALEQHSAEMRLALSAAQQNMAQLKADYAVQETKLDHATSQLHSLQEQMNTLIHSRSWKITAPLRAMRNIFK